MRKISGMLLMILLAFALAACGGDDGDDDEETEATEPPAATEAATEAEDEATEEPTEEESVAATAVAGGEEASPAASPVAGADDATPVSGMDATPETGMDAVPVMGDDADASPVASPMASPVGGPDSATPEAAVPGNVVAGATPSGVVSTEGETAATISLNGAVQIEGAENQAWTMTENGCVGLGSHADMQAGRQVIVRDESGTIVGVTQLAAGETADTCSWTFGLDVPESEFYEVSIPMKTVLVFSHQDVAANDGEVTLILP